MCGIGGVVCFDSTERNTIYMNPFLEALKDRGRDAYGIVSFEANRCEEAKYNEPITVYKQFGNQSLPLLLANGLSERNNPLVVMAAARAEPTSISESVDLANDEDMVQPYATLSGSLKVVCHNGTIANDEGFNKTFTLPPDQNKGRRDKTIPIDSAVLCGFSARSIINSIASKDLMGSFAIAMYDNNRISLIKNYLPMHILIDYTSKRIWWSNVMRAFYQLSFIDIVGYHYEIIDVPAYSSVEFGLEDFDVAVFLIKEQLRYSGRLYPVQEQKAFVICSSGLDSTTVAKMAVQQYGAKNTCLLHYTYGCKAQENELARIRQIAYRLQCGLKVIDLSSVFTNMKSSILGKEGEITEGDTAIEYAKEWVPARNLIMMSVAIGVAENEGYTVVMLGSNLTEQAAYPDNSLDFTYKLNELAPYAVQNGHQIKIVTPVVNMMKNEIVALGTKIGTPYELTWSCYHDGDKPCGVCGPCVMRRLAFEKNGLRDPAQ